MPSQQILLCFIFLSNLSSRVLLYFSLPYFFLLLLASSLSFLQLVRRVTPNSSNTVLQLSREGQCLHSLVHLPLCIMEKREGIREKKTLSNSQRKGEVSGAAIQLLCICSPSVGRGSGSQQEGETTSTPSALKETLIHCCRQKIIQKEKLKVCTSLNYLVIAFILINIEMWTREISSTIKTFWQKMKTNSLSLIFFTLTGI